MTVLNQLHLLVSAEQFTFLGSPEGSNEINMWRVNTSGVNMDVEYRKWEACKIQVIEPKADRNTFTLTGILLRKLNILTSGFPKEQGEHLLQSVCLLMKTCTVNMLTCLNC